MSLKELVTRLSKEVDGMRSELLDREDKLSNLLKHMIGVLCDYDSETRDMVETLHRTRDEQVILYTLYCYMLIEYHCSR